MNDAYHFTPLAMPPSPVRCQISNRGYFSFHKLLGGAGQRDIYMNHFIIT